MIQVSGVTKHFGDFRALDDVSLEIAKGEMVALDTIVEGLVALKKSRSLVNKVV